MKTNIYPINNIEKQVANDMEISENIFFEMEKLGIDTQPFIELAATDLFNQYGMEALQFADQIYQDFFDLNDVQSSRIWRKIINVLMMINQKSNMMYH